VTARRRPAVDVAIDEGVAWVTLGREQLDVDVCAGLVEACEAIDTDDAVRVVVMAGAGRALCRGLPADVGWPPSTWPDGVGALARCTRPVIGCVTGEVQGWGVALALACDLRVAASTAVLRLPEASAGRLAGGGVTQRLTRIVGPSRALDLLLLGTEVSARTALAWGLVSRVVAPARVHGTAERLARELSARGPLALRLAKETVVRALDLPLDDGVRLEHDLYVLMQTTADRTEGITAFRARRPPRFTGR
jgi:enoyl-CoA hydratase/carnithine racemase